jgi:hypothetical protein
MKTSNKLLLALIGVAMIFVLSIMIYVRANLREPKKEEPVGLIQKDNSVILALKV